MRAHDILFANREFVNSACRPRVQCLPAPGGRRVSHPALSPPLLTPDLPGAGGRIKAEPDDFEVAEIPAYEPAGAGDHLYLWVEKRGVGPEYFVKQVARRLGVHPADAGTAGLKDQIGRAHV